MGRTVVRPDPASLTDPRSLADRPRRLAQEPHGAVKGCGLAGAGGDGRRQQFGGADGNSSAMDSAARNSPPHFTAPSVIASFQTPSVASG